MGEVGPRAGLSVVSMSKKIDFPNLKDEDWQQCSPVDPSYNCIAYAAGRTDVYWWPDPFAPPLHDYWPQGVPCEETLDAFIQLYRTFGYEPCDASDNGSLEPGYEKIALFAIGTTPTHAAKQLPDGRWTSKLGLLEDIEHDDLACLNGPCYGSSVQFLRRSLSQ
jgi:hypothetical protein